MGVTIACKKTHNSIDMGAGGFLRIRRKVSDLIGEPWASHYRTLTDISSIHRDDAWYDKFDRKTAEFINNKTVNIKLVDFLLQSDIQGLIHYGACKQILKIIGDYDDNILYGYAGLPNCARFQDFKNLLQQCAEHKCDLIWY